MKAPALDFVRPHSVDDAIMAASGGGVLLAGGQSLLPMLNLRVADAHTVIWIARLQRLMAVTETPASVIYGAATPHAAFEDGHVPDASRGLMRKVASGIAYRAVRNFGTIGGAVALADPAADWPVCLVALAAIAIITGPAGERRMPVADLVKGPYTTDLASDEIIVAFDVRRLAPTAKWGHVKIARQRGAYADSLACVVMPAQGAVPRVVLGAASAGVIQLADTARLLGQAPDVPDATVKETILSDLARAEPEGDPHRLRCHLAAVTRAIAQARAA